MERSVSVEDFLGGLLRLNKNGMGSRTDSEAAFQEFLKRIPSAQNLAAHQGAPDDRGSGKPQTSVAQLPTTAYSNGHAAASQPATSRNEYAASYMPRVPSLDLLRCVQQPMDPAGQQAAPPQSGMVAVNPQTLPQHLRPPSNQAVQFSQQMAVPNMPGMHVANSAQQQVAAPNLSQLQLPNLNGLNLMQALPAFQQTGQGQTPMHLANIQAAAAMQLNELGLKFNIPNAEQAEKQEQRRARRMLSNRESARRSRKRKQEQLGDLECQIRELEEKQENLEAQCQQAAMHVSNLMEDKRRLEKENDHLMKILRHLQDSLGKEKISAVMPDWPLSGGDNGAAEPQDLEADDKAMKHLRDAKDVKALPSPTKAKRAAAMARPSTFSQPKSKSGTAAGGSRNTSPSLSGDSQPKRAAQVLMDPALAFAQRLKNLGVDVSLGTEKASKESQKTGEGRQMQKSVSLNAIMSVGA